MSVLVRFDAALRLLDYEVPETLNYATIHQAVQDSVGFAGINVVDVTEYEHQSSNSGSGDRPVHPGATRTLELVRRIADCGVGPDTTAEQALATILALIDIRASNSHSESE